MPPSDGLLDRRTGIVTDLVPRPLPPRAPALLRLWQARLSDTTAFSPWPGDPVASGCAWGCDDSARLAALGEAVERYCGALVPAGLQRTGAARLRNAGHLVLDTSALALFSEAQYRTPGFPFVPFSEDLPLRWVSGRDLPTGAPRAVPINLVYTTTHRHTSRPGGYHDEPRTNPLPYAGLAAGTSRDQAETNALLELIERDAVTTSWISGTAWPPIVVPDSVTRMLESRSGAVRVRLFHVPAAITLPVIAAVVEDPVTGFLALGTAARSDPTRAALKATAEACQLHLMLAELDDPGSTVMRLAAADAGCPILPWRPDRRYRDSYAPGGWRAVRDLACQLQLYLDPEIRTAFRDRLAHPPTTPLADLAGGVQDTSGCLVDALGRLGISPVSVDVTSSDVRATGWTAVRVVAPGLYPNTPAAFPTLGGNRHTPPASATPALPLPYA